MKTRISQSLVHDLLDYEAGDLCGNLIEWKHVLEEDLPSSAAQALGHYFEYIATGALPPDGKIPQAEYQKNGKDMYAPYKRAYDNGMRVRDKLQAWGFKVLYTRKKYTKGRYHGTIDIVVEATWDIVFDDGTTIKKGEIFVIDLKYSGLLDDKWNKFGWMMTDVQVYQHRVQAIHYNFITDMRFFYLVCNSANDQTDLKFFEVEVRPKSKDAYLEMANDLFARFQLTAAGMGFTPRPEYNRCNSCPLKDECSDKHEFPHVQKIVV